MEEDEDASLVQHHPEDQASLGAEDPAGLEVLHDDQGLAGHTLGYVVEGRTAAPVEHERLPGKEAHRAGAQRASNGKLLLALPEDIATLVE